MKKNNKTMTSRHATRKSPSNERAVCAKTKLKGEANMRKNQMELKKGSNHFCCKTTKMPRLRGELKTTAAALTVSKEKAKDGYQKTIHHLQTQMPRPIGGLSKLSQNLLTKFLHHLASQMPRPKGGFRATAAAITLAMLGIVPMTAKSQAYMCVPCPTGYWNNGEAECKLISSFTFPDEALYVFEEATLNENDENISATLELQPGCYKVIMSGGGGGGGGASNGSSVTNATGGAGGKGYINTDYFCLTGTANTTITYTVGIGGGGGGIGNSNASSTSVGRFGANGGHTTCLAPGNLMSAAGGQGGQGGIRTRNQDTGTINSYTGTSGTGGTGSSGGSAGSSGRSGTAGTDGYVKIYAASNATK